MQIYNKLVRDKIDEIINNNGKNEEAIIRILTDEEYKLELLKKLNEELGELTEAIHSGITEDIIEEDIDISSIGSSISGKDDKVDISNIAVKIEREEVYAGLTIEELTLKLNRYLRDKGALANQGSLIATQSLAMGVDPYVAVAIMMHETVCN